MCVATSINNLDLALLNVSCFDTCVARGHYFMFGFTMDCGLRRLAFQQIRLIHVVEFVSSNLDRMSDQHSRCGWKYTGLFAIQVVQGRRLWHSACPREITSFVFHESSSLCFQFVLSLLYLSTSII